jgi:hypothetical protein
MSSTCESAKARLSTRIHTSIATGVEFEHVIPRNSEERYSDFYLFGSETGKIVTADKKHWLESRINV